MLSTYVSYQRITANLDRSLSLKAAEPSVTLESKYYLENISKVDTIDDLLADTRLFRYAMTAFGLEELAHAKGMMRKVLEGGITEQNSFANRLNDDRFIDFAKVFDFNSFGSGTTITAQAKQGVVDRYVRQTLEVDAGSENEGVRLALYFERAAPEVSSVYGLLADSALSKVVKSVLGLPDEMATADIDKQAAAISARLDLEDLQDPEKLNRFIQRFTAIWDAQQVTTNSPVLSLFDTYTAPSIGLDLVMTLHNLKLGGT